MPDAKSEREPAEVFPPGAFLAEEMEERGLSRDWLAKWSGLSRETIDSLFAGDIRLSMNMAERLERATGIRAAMLVSLELSYRKHLAKLEKKRNA